MINKTNSLYHICRYYNGIWLKATMKYLAVDDGFDILISECISFHPKVSTCTTMQIMVGQF
ncbi:hypothetical protein T07_6503 [Trichinella nelsoni]|uniref:Uncharacterized protein n=1 Tax=Trichinella nelsoni TaxID=6336 RepID=A0A0V0SDP5_9BILA|nr:hypothetical protein T07_6503 [Trichinella nelsoni]